MFETAGLVAPLPPAQVGLNRKCLQNFRQQFTFFCSIRRILFSFSLHQLTHHQKRHNAKTKNYLGENIVKT